MNLKKACHDMKYLLDRGYKKTTALNFVANHYGLSKHDRNFLVRYVFSENEIRDHKSRLIPLRKITGKNLVIDTYNLLITVQAITSGNEVVKGMDGFLRDTSAVFSKYKFNEDTRDAIENILRILSKHRPKSVLFVLDSRMSRSGELASCIREKLEEFYIPGDARVSRYADREIIKRNRITATSDSIIIEKVKNVVDIGKSLLFHLLFSTSNYSNNCY